MKSKMITVLGLTLIAAGLTLGQSASDNEQARLFADSILQLKDRGNYGQIYDLFIPELQGSRTKAEWVAYEATVHSKLGTPKARSFDGVTAKGGIYRVAYIAEYQTFQAGDYVFVVNNGGWKVAGIRLVHPLKGQ